jgi:hypothetical protein
MHRSKERNWIDCSDPPPIYHFWLAKQLFSQVGNCTFFFNVKFDWYKILYTSLLAVPEYSSRYCVYLIKQWRAQIACSPT